MNDINTTHETAQKGARKIHQLKVHTGELLAAMTLTNTATEKRNTIPVLYFMRFSIEGNQLTLTATDLDNEMSVQMECESVGKWAFLTEAAPLIRLLKGVQGITTIAFDPTEETLVLRTEDGLTLTRRNLISVTDFPELKTQTSAGELTISETELHTALTYARHCISTEETRYYLNGIFFCAGGKGLRMVSTDGHRLCRFDCETAGTPPSERIIHSKTLRILHKFIRAGGNGSVTIEFLDATKIRFSSDSYTLTAKTIDGKFPDYNRVIPSGEEYEIDFTVSPESMRRLAALASCFSARVEIQCQNERAIFEDLGKENSLSVPIQTRTPSAPNIAFNGRYLQQLTRITGNLRLRATAPNSPAAAVPEDARALFILMPMR